MIPVATLSGWRVVIDRDAMADVYCTDSQCEGAYLSHVAALVAASRGAGQCSGCALADGAGVAMETCAACHACPAYTFPMGAVRLCIPCILTGEQA